MQFQLSRLLQIAWKVLFCCCIILYGWVTVKLTTPLINQYAKQLIEPVVVKRLPRGFALGGAYLAWDELRPFIILEGIDAVQPDSIPYVKHISNMDIRLDVIDSWRRKALVIDDIHIEHITLALAKRQMQLSQVEDALTQVLGETRSRYTEHSRFTVPHSLSIETLAIALDDHVLTANQVTYRDHAPFKDWNLVFRRFDDQSLYLQTVFTAEENAHGIEKADGQVQFRGTMPAYLLSYISAPLTVDAFSGMLQGQFHYQQGERATVELTHQLDVAFHYADAPPLTIQAFKGHSAVAYQAGSDWDVSGQVEQLRINQIPSSAFTYHFTQNTAQQHQLRISQFNVAHAHALAPLAFTADSKLRQILDRVTLRGGIEDLVMEWNGAWTSLSTLHFTLSDFSTTANADIPGLSGIQATVALDHDAGVIQLFEPNSHRNHVVEVADTRWFDHSVVLDVEPTQIRFTHQDNNWVFDSEAFQIDWAHHLIRGSGHMVLRPDDYPDLQLALHTDTIRIADIQGGLPVKWLPAGLNNYLRTALQNGSLLHNAFSLTAHADQGHMVWAYNGQAQLHDVMMQYAPGWPAVEHANGMLRLNDTKLDIDIDDLSVNAQQVHKTHVAIADLLHPQVDLKIHDTINLQRGLAFIHNSPLEAKIGRYLSRAHMSGDGVLDMALSVAVGEKQPLVKALTGKIDLAHDVIAFPDYHVDLHDVIGPLFFTESTLHAADLVGKQQKAPLTLSLDSQAEGLAIGFQGQVDVLPLLQGRLPRDVLSHLSGKPYLQGRILIDTVDDKPYWTIEAEAPHGGIAVDFPPPLRLQAKQKQPIKASLHIKDDVVQDVRIRYLKGVQVQWNHGKKGGEDQLQIQAPRFAYKAWEPLLQDDGLHMTLPPLRLQVKDAVFYDYHFADMALVVRNTDNQFDVRVDSPQVAGRIALRPHQSLTAKLSRLILPSLPQGAGSGGSLASMDYRVQVDDLQVEAHHYRHVDLLLKQQYAGYIIDHADVEMGGNQIKVRGDWQYGTKPKTYLEGEIESVDLGTLLAYFPDMNSLQGGKGTTKFKLTWPERIEKLRVKDMRGIVNFNLSEGKISNLGEKAEAGIGVGVLFNILSLNSLINKISFDFSDLGHESYPFDALIGDFTLGHGQIKTDKIMVKGKLGTVYSRGTVDIKNAQLDVYLTIMPIVTSSLPTIAALAGGAVAGIIAWTASQLIEEPVSEMALQAYHISGAVDNPVLTELDKNHLPDAVVLA